MTSGLFNTGGTGDSVELTSQALTVQPSTSKFMGELSAESDHFEIDMNMFENLGADFTDPLGDASMDSYTDLTAFLSENSFLDQDAAADSPIPDFDTEVKPPLQDCKLSFAKVEDSSDLGKLSARVGLVKTSSHDHDYTAKRPRMSAVTEEPSSVEHITVDKVFLSTILSCPALSPAPAPTPSPAPSTSEAAEEHSMEDKYRNRREKNNIASKRSREIRKRKFVDMEQEAEQLIIRNAQLEKHVVKLEQMAKKMKEILVAKMAGN